MDAEEEIYMGTDAQGPVANISCEFGAAPTSPPPAPTPALAVPADDISLMAKSGDVPAQMNTLSPGGRSIGEGATLEKEYTLTPGVLKAMMDMRVTMMGSLEHERSRLTMSCLDVGKTVKDIRRRLHGERDRMRYIERKVAEKYDSHDRARQQFLRARQVLETASIDDFGPTRSVQKEAVKSFIAICEEALQTWHDNCGHSHSRLQSWEYKLKRQTERVTKITEELARAEVIAKEKHRHLDNSLKRVQALMSFLGSL